MLLIRNIVIITTKRSIAVILSKSLSTLINGSIHKYST